MLKTILLNLPTATIASALRISSQNVASKRRTLLRYAGQIETILRGAGFEVILRRIEEDVTSNNPKDEHNPIQGGADGPQ